VSTEKNSNIKSQQKLENSENDDGYISSIASQTFDLSITRNNYVKFIWTILNNFSFLL
jgi:hypothetical protein